MSCTTIFDNDSTLVQPPTFAQDFGCAFRASNHDAAATSKLRFNPDGTWSVSRTFGVASNGNWHVGVPANPADFEIRITGNVQRITTTSGTVDCLTPPYQETNTAVDTGWLPMNIAREEEAWAYATANIVCDSQDTSTVFTFTVQIRQISNPANTVTGSGSVCAEASAMAN